MPRFVSRTIFGSFPGSAGLMVSGAAAVTGEESSASSSAKIYSAPISLEGSLLLLMRFTLPEIFRHKGAFIIKIIWHVEVLTVGKRLVILGVEDCFQLCLHNLLMPLVLKLKRNAPYSVVGNKFAGLLTFRRSVAAILTTSVCLLAFRRGVLTVSNGVFALHAVSAIVSITANNIIIVIWCFRMKYTSVPSSYFDKVIPDAPLVKNTVTS